ncbi:MAG: OprO/OprP family phosphate-selective porin [Bacteroidales bacterium]|nr:OprO/OprP family phosphate-selective porin [Bacteroidales bacterium]MCF8390753.1 OprO/OprP family phosphate-selective porin [Bacteroidales bacterium]
MKKAILYSLLTLFVGNITAQDLLNSAEKLLETEGKLKIGGYGEIHFNQELSPDIVHNADLDVHRLVLLFGYQFSEKTQLISELEFEHVVEVYIEQAFIQHKLNKYMNFRAGLLLIPMGIINEYHEPTAFFGVERPDLDKYVSPTTWREIGLGFSGTILPASLKYQVYVVNGFQSFDGSPLLSGSNGFRKGRQKGIESTMSTPNYTGKIEYFGLRGLNLGISSYFGKTQSSLYDGLNKNDNTMTTKADSSVVGVNMLGLDARYSIKGWQFRGQYYYTSISNTKAYNEFTANSSGVANNLGSSITGYYIEAAYNIFGLFEESGEELYPFLRYENYDMHHSVAENVSRNNDYNNTIITTGLSYKLEKNVVLKGDFQFLKTKSDEEYTKIFSLGLGFIF